MRRIAFIWLPRWAIDRRRVAGPFALYQAERGALLLAHVDDAAMALGLHPGLPLGEARARCPNLRAEAATPEEDRAALFRLARWCRRYTPWSRAEPPDGIWLDITGCAHLFGGEASLLGLMAREIARLDHRPRLGLAGTSGAAWALARFAKSPALLPEGNDLAEALAPLPVAALRLPEDMVESLVALGLRHMGNLLPVPRADLARRFGAGLPARLDQALGRVPEPLSPEQAQAPLRLLRRFDDPVGDARHLAHALDALLAKLCILLDTRGLGARRLRLALFEPTGACRDLTIGTSTACRESSRFVALFAPKLESLRCEFGWDALLLEALQTAPIKAAQPDFNASPAGAGLAALIDGIGNRLGFAALSRPACHESWLPERASVFLDVGAPPPPPTPPALPAGLEYPGRNAPGGQAPPGPGMPLTLLAQPESILAEADGTPPRSFRWRRQRHELARAWGPMRRSDEWWTRPDRRPLPDRDYWTVEDTSGRRLFLFAQNGSWYVQGVLP
jgi:protein ImuB